MRVQIEAIALAVVTIIGVQATAFGAVLADFTLSEWAAPYEDISISQVFTDTSVLDSNLAVAGQSVMEDGSALPHGVASLSANNPGEININKWTALDNGNLVSNHFSIEVTPTAGFGVDLESIEYSLAGNGPAAPRQWYVWVVSGSYQGAVLDIADAADFVELNAVQVADDPDGDLHMDGIVGRNWKLFNLSGVGDQHGVFSIVLGAKAGGGLTPTAKVTPGSTISASTVPPSFPSLLPSH